MAATDPATVDGERAAPRASALLESLRGFGYSLGSAIADLVDNSISAGAQNVWIQFQWSGADSWARIVDDGHGMSVDELVQAMTLGTVGPLGTRLHSDLGRFGLGLKTASFSQCRRFTVATKIAAPPEYAVRAWDLDVVARTQDWILRRDVPAEIAELLTPLAGLQHGTAIIWQCMDRVVGPEPIGNRNAEEQFWAAVDAVKRHLAMVFHRFLAGVPAVRMFMNGTEDWHRVRPWDPFLTAHPTTQATPIERLFFKGEWIALQGFILPHRDRMTDSEFEAAGGPAGWGAQQGFYVYRNNRLVVAGGWLGLGDSRPWTREEQYKLARISVQFPNSLDSDWHLDVKKSVAFPPREIRDRMAVLAKAVRDLSRRAYIQRDRLGDTSVQSTSVANPWVVSEGNSTPKYLVNRSHPLVAKVSAPVESREDVESLLRLIELTVPVQRIWLDSAEAMSNPDAQASSLPTIEDVLRVARQLLRAMQDHGGMTTGAARYAVLTAEPFCHFQQLPELLRDE